MFYIRLKDGRELITAIQSDDVAEFHKVIESELGDQAVEVFDTLICEASQTNPTVLNNYRTCINSMDKELKKDEVDKEKLKVILSNLKDIYIDLS